MFAQRSVVPTNRAGAVGRSVRRRSDRDRLRRRPVPAAAGAAGALPPAGAAAHPREVRDESLADELTQDTYARALERLGQLRDPQAALAWLYRIATTVSLDRLRQRRPPTVALDDDEPDGAADAPSLLAAGLEQSEMSECVQGYLAALPDDYRVAILLRDVHGLGNPEIAALLGCSLATAKIRVHRARARLREALASACSFELDERGVLVCEPGEASR